MIKSFKISGAIFICAAFIFRILFVNVSTISSINSPQNKSQAEARSSILKKRKDHFGAFDNIKAREYSIIEICEEDSNEDDQFKASPYLVAHFLSSRYVSNLKNENTTTKPFYGVLSQTSSRRYISFQVFRI